MPGNFGAQKVTVGAYRDPTTGLREAFRSIGSRADKATERDRVELLRQEELARTMARQDVLDDRYTSVVTLEADRFDTGQFDKAYAQEVKYADLNRQNWMNEGSKGEYAPLDRTSEFNVKHGSRKGYRDVSGVGSSSAAKEYQARLSKIGKDNRAQNRAQEMYDAENRFNAAMRAQGDITTPRNTAFRAQVDANGMEVPENVAGAIDRVNTEQGTAQDIAIVDQYNRLAQQQGAKYIDERAMNYGEKMLALEPTIGKNVYYDKQLGLKEVSTEVSKAKSDEQGRKDLVKLYEAKAKVQKGSGKTATGGTVEKGVNQAVFKALGITGKKKPSTKLINTVSKYADLGYNSNQIAGIIGKNYSPSKDYTWAQWGIDKPEKFGDDLDAAFGSVEPQNVVVNGGTAAYDREIAKINQRLSGKTLVDDSYRKYQNSLRGVDKAAVVKAVPDPAKVETGTVRAPIEVRTKSVFEHKPVTQSVKEIRADILKANKAKDYKLADKLRGDLEVANLSKNELRVALRDANTSGNRTLAANIKAIIDAK